MFVLPGARVSNMVHQFYLHACEGDRVNNIPYA